MLKSVVADIESVDESLRALYVEQGDGRYVLDVEPVDGLALENVTGLKTALSAERRKVADAEESLVEAKERLARYGGMDPRAAAEALNRINSGEVGTLHDLEKTVADRVEAMRVSIAATAGAEATAARTELDTLKGTLAKREGQLEKLLKASAIRTELDRVKPVDDAVDALMLMAEQHVKMVEIDGQLKPQVIDRNGEQRLDAKGAPMSVASFMTELRDTRPALFKPIHTASGLGMGGSTSGRGAGHTGEPNPFSREGWNLTQQVIMQKRDPAKAARLKGMAA